MHSSGNPRLRDIPPDARGPLYEVWLARQPLFDPEELRRYREAQAAPAPVTTRPRAGRRNAELVAP